MAERLGARKNSGWKAICMAPDICKTPMGPNVIPIPYMIIADLGLSDNTVPNVRFNGDPCKVLDQSIVPRCTGDEPGTAGGVRSGTVSDEVKPVSACSNVRAGGRQIVRELDPCTMNRGNCSHALYFIQPAPGSCFTAGGTPSPKAHPPAETTPAEKEGFLKKWLKQTKSDLDAAGEHPGEAVKGAVKGTVNMVPELGNVLAQGSALKHAAEMEERAALLRMFGSSRAADQMQAGAEALRQSSGQISFPKLDISHPAAAAGDRLATIVQLFIGGAGLLKSGARAGIKALAKSGGRALAGKTDDVARLGSTASREARAADTALDAAGQGAKKAPKKDGVRIEQPPMSLREEYLGRTPGKGSKTGKDVIERMREEGKIREGVKGTEFQASNGKWYPLEKADMAHKVDAVTWWNETGRHYGAKAPKVREWMLDSKNYTLDHYSRNRSLGAVLGQTQRYLPPP